MVLDYCYRRHHRKESSLCGYTPLAFSLTKGLHIGVLCKLLYPQPPSAICYSPYEYLPQSESVYSRTAIFNRLHLAMFAKRPRIQLLTFTSYILVGNSGFLFEDKD